VLTLLVMLLGSSCAGGSEASDSTSDDGEPDSSATESSAQDNVDESGAEVLTPAGTRWVVDSLIASTGAAESVAPLGGDDLAWMAFGQGVLVGEIGCVGFRGGYTLDGDAMELTDEIEQSVGDCDQPHPLENEVVPALDLVTTWSSDGARLDLLGDDGVIISMLADGPLDPTREPSSADRPGGLPADPSGEFSSDADETSTATVLPAASDYSVPDQTPAPSTSPEEPSSLAETPVPSPTSGAPGSSPGVVPPTSAAAG